MSISEDERWRIAREAAQQEPSLTILSARKWAIDEALRLRDSARDARVLALLKRIESEGSDNHGGPACPECQLGMEFDRSVRGLSPHLPDCELAALIRELEGKS